MAEPQGAKSEEPRPAAPAEKADSAKKYWWIGVIAMPLLLFVLTRFWPESKPSSQPAPVTNVSTVQNFTTVQNEIQNFTGQPLNDDLKKVIEQALALTAKGDASRSIPLYKEAVQQAPVPALYTNLGAAYLQTGNSAEAKGALQKALDKDPHYEAAMRNLPLTIAPYFSDQFDGSTLGRDWTMANSDPKNWIMQPASKSVLIRTQPGRLQNSKNFKNLLTLNRELPSGDFEVIVDAAIQIQGIGNDLFGGLFEDDRNYFVVGFGGQDAVTQMGRTIYLNQLVDGKLTEFHHYGYRWGAAVAAERFFLRIKRSVNQYSGSYAFVDAAKAGPEWTELGTLPAINFKGKLVLGAVNSNDGAPNVAAEFYSVVIRKL